MAALNGSISFEGELPLSLLFPGDFIGSLFNRIMKLLSLLNAPNLIHAEGCIGGAL